MNNKGTPTSMRQKLFMGALLTTLSALLIFAATIIGYDLRDFRQRAVDDLGTQSDLVGLTVAPALQFDDRSLAAASLRIFRTRPQIVRAAIYDLRGGLFATYAAGPDAAAMPFPALPRLDGYGIEGSRIATFKRIVENDEIVGAVYLEARYPLYERLLQYGSIVVAVMLLALIASMLLSIRVQRRLTRPVLGITDVAREVVNKRDFSLRAEKVSNDEIGYLVDAFNDLLSEVQARSTALEDANGKLREEIRERQAATLAQGDSERRHRTLLNALTAMVWTADADGNFKAEQHSWSDYTGQRREEYRGYGWLEAIHENDRAIFQRAWREARNDEHPFHGELRLWHAGTGTFRYVWLHAVPLYDNQGGLVEWIGTADDIDDRHRAVAEIEQLNTQLEQRVAARTEELERANRELEAFSYSVSHDLRAPLRAIDGFSQALLEDYDEALDDTGQDYLRRVRFGAQRMGRLIDDLLKLARVSRAELNEAVIDLGAIAAAVINELRASDPDRTVEVRIASGLVAAADPHLMRIALENLLNNAWKYTARKASAEIEFGMRPQGGKPCFFVQDNGAGFDMAYAGKLFGAFQRLHDSKEYAGTGVGLATVQRIIHRHGGLIWADAAVDRGAVFYFTLPATTESEHDDETDSARRRQPG